MNDSFSSRNFSCLLENPAKMDSFESLGQLESMESSEDNQDSVIDKEIDQNCDEECDEGESNYLGKNGPPVHKLKLKELPSVHKSKKKERPISSLSLFFDKESFNEKNMLDPKWWKPFWKLGDSHLLSRVENELNVAPNSWTIGGSLGTKTAVLLFRCIALSNPPDDPPANQLHMTYKTVQAETKLLAAVLNSHGFREVHPNIPDFNLLWTGIHPKPHTLKNLTSYQRVNHFPRSSELTRKDRLFKNIEKMQRAKGAKHFDFIPQTFVMPTDFRELCSNHYRSKGPWIVKPVASSRGRGIYIVNSPDQVPLDETLVVAKYIDNPLLVDGHKCDLRLYVAVTSYDPLIVYMYEEGLVRFATVKYDTTGKHLWNPCMHLCNYSINKYHSDYVMNEDADTENVGHKWTLSALLRHLRSQNVDTGILMNRIEEVVVKAILASAPPIVSACRMFVPYSHNCFELYGFDILIDSSLKPWLLEVNLSPSLGCDSPLDVRVKSAMLVDLLTLVGLPAVDPMIRRVGELRRLTTPSDVARKITQCRRVQSADTLVSSVNRHSSGNPSRLASSSLSLPAEESKMVKHTRAEYDRRGGFVRIFPSSESWKRYSQFLDPATGLVITASSNFVEFPMTTFHNYNYMLHQQLFPELQTDGSSVVRATSSQPSGTSLRFPSPDRVSRYERALSQGHKYSLNGSHLEKTDAEGVHAEEVQEVGVILKEVLSRLEKGERLSQYQARKLFGQYLICILRRMTKNGNKPEENGNVEIILRFLQKASSNLRTPYFVQMPSRKLSGKDRLAMVAKQLNDFIYLYNRETDLYTDSVDHPNQLPSRIFLEFLAVAREADLEEALTAHTKVNKCAHLFLGRCGINISQSFGLLRPFPPINSGREECSCRKTCHRSRDPKLTSVTERQGQISSTMPRTTLPPAISPNKKITAKVSRML